MAHTSPPSSSWRKQGSGRVAPWPAARVVGFFPTVLYSSMWYFLCNLDSTRDPFYSLAAAKTGHRKWSTGRQLGRRLATVRMASGGAPASRVCVEVSLCSLLVSCTANCFKRWRKTRIWLLPRVRRVLDLQVKIHTMGCAIYRGF
jgi:hypothetical protein